MESESSQESVSMATGNGDITQIKNDSDAASSGYVPSDGVDAKQKANFGVTDTDMDDIISKLTGDETDGSAGNFDMPPFGSFDMPPFEGTHGTMNVEVPSVVDVSDEMIVKDDKDGASSGEENSDSDENEYNCTDSDVTDEDGENTASWSLSPVYDFGDSPSDSEDDDTAKNEYDVLGEKVTLPSLYPSKNKPQEEIELSAEQIQVVHDIPVESRRSVLSGPSTKEHDVNDQHRVKFHSPTSMIMYDPESALVEGVAVEMSEDLHDSDNEKEGQEEVKEVVEEGPITFMDEPEDNETETSTVLEADVIKDLKSVLEEIRSSQHEEKVLPPKHPDLTTGAIDINKDGIENGSNNEISIDDKTKAIDSHIEAVSQIQESEEPDTTCLEGLNKSAEAVNEAVKIEYESGPILTSEDTDNDNTEQNNNQTIPEIAETFEDMIETKKENVPKLIEPKLSESVEFEDRTETSISNNTNVKSIEEPSLIHVEPLDKTFDEDLNPNEYEVRNGIMDNKSEIFDSDRNIEEESSHLHDDGSKLKITEYSRNDTEENKSAIDISDKAEDKERDAIKDKESEPCMDTTPEIENTMEEIVEVEYIPPNNTSCIDLRETRHLMELEVNQEDEDVANTTQEETLVTTVDKVWRIVLFEGMQLLYSVVVAVTIIFDIPLNNVCMVDYVVMREKYQTTSRVITIIFGLSGVGTVFYHDLTELEYSMNILTRHS